MPQEFQQANWMPHALAPLLTMTERLIGSYRREPAELPHHTIKIEKLDDELIWKPDGDSKGWSLELSKEDDTLLLVSEACPDYEDCKQVTVELEEDKVIGLRFNGELYAKKDFIFEIPAIGLVENAHNSQSGDFGGSDNDSDFAVADKDYRDDLSTDGA